MGVFIQPIPVENKSCNTEFEESKSFCAAKLRHSALYPIINLLVPRLLLRLSTIAEVKVWTALSKPFTEPNSTTN
jgi:hypothetical protein